MFSFPQNCLESKYESSVLVRLSLIFLIDHHFNKLPFSQRFVQTLNVCHAAKPQSTTPCNHVMSDSVELDILTEKKGKLEWILHTILNYLHTSCCNRPSCNKPCETGVETRFNKDYFGICSRKRVNCSGQ